MSGLKPGAYTSSATPPLFWSLIEVTLLFKWRMKPLHYFYANQLLVGTVGIEPTNQRSKRSMHPLHIIPSEYSYKFLAMVLRVTGREDRIRTCVPRRTNWFPTSANRSLWHLALYYIVLPAIHPGGMVMSFAIFLLEIPFVIHLVPYWELDFPC